MCRATIFHYNFFHFYSIVSLFIIFIHYFFHLASIIRMLLFFASFDECFTLLRYCFIFAFAFLFYNLFYERKSINRISAPFFLSSTLFKTKGWKWILFSLENGMTTFCNTISLLSKCLPVVVGIASVHSTWLHKFILFCFVGKVFFS